MSDNLKSNIRIAIAELIGTFILVLISCGVAVYTGNVNVVDNNGDVVAVYTNVVAIALAFGLSLICIIYTLGNISGAHVNPAVSLVMALNKKITWIQFIWYVGAQLVGAFLGSLVLWLIIGKWGTDPVNSVGQNGLLDHEWYSIVSGLLVEIILTCIFLLVIICVTSTKFSAGKKAGIIIGMALIVVHLFGIFSLTGTSVNPARSFGPAIVMLFEGNNDAIIDLWVCIVGPLAGAVLAWVIAKWLIKTEDSSAK